MQAEDGQMSLYPGRRMTLSLIRYIMNIIFRISYKRQTYLVQICLIQKCLWCIEKLENESRLKIEFNLLKTDKDG